MMPSGFCLVAPPEHFILVGDFVPSSGRLRKGFKHFWQSPGVPKAPE